jgi:hypothetical protein
MMADPDNFPQLFGGVFPPENLTNFGVAYGPLGDDLIGSLRLDEVTQAEILAAIYANSAFGRGGIEKTVTVRVAGEPVDGAAVWVTLDPEGSQTIAGTLYTNIYGQVKFMLEPGNYYVWTQRGDDNFNNPTPLEVTA